MGNSRSGLSEHVTIHGEPQNLAREHGTTHGEHQNLAPQHGTTHGEHQSLAPEHGTTHGEHQNPSAHTPAEPPAPPTEIEEEQVSGQTAAVAASAAPPLPTTVMVIGDATIARFIQRRGSSTALDLEVGGGRNEIRNRLHRWLGEGDVELEVLHTSRRETEADPIPQQTMVTSTPSRLLQFLTRWYPCWEIFTSFIAICLSFLTPFEFGFLFPTAISWPVMVVDGAICLIGILDCSLEWYLWGKGIIRRTCDYYWILHTFDFIGCGPWVILYKLTRSEFLRPFIMARIFRVRKAYDLLQKLKSCVRTHYIRSILVLSLEIFCVNIFWAHVEGCIAYYLATVWPDPQNTWISCYDKNQRNEHVGKNYIPSLYFLMVTISTIGYGDMHPVNELEMSFVVTAAIFNMCLTFYLSALFSYLLQTMEMFRSSYLLQTMERFRRNRA